MKKEYLIPKMEVCESFADEAFLAGSPVTHYGGAGEDPEDESEGDLEEETNPAKRQSVFEDHADAIMGFWETYKTNPYLND